MPDEVRAVRAAEPDEPAEVRVPGVRGADHARAWGVLHGSGGYDAIQRAAAVRATEHVEEERSVAEDHDWTGAIPEQRGKVMACSFIWFLFRVVF